MMRPFTIPQQAASDYCPAVPRTIRVYGTSPGNAVMRLAEVLKKDPDLKEPHPELTQAPEADDGKSSVPSKKK